MKNFALIGASGYIAPRHLKDIKETQFEKARVRWFLSIDENDLPTQIKENQQRTYRSILIDNEEIEFSAGFTDLHTESYEEIIKGNAFNLIDVRRSINCTPY